MTVQNNTMRQFNLLNVKQCTEAPSDIKHASVKARVYVEEKLNASKLSNVLLMQKRKEKYAFKVPLSTVVLIEPYGIIIHYRSLLLLIQ